MSTITGQRVVAGYPTFTGQSGRWEYTLRVSESYSEQHYMTARRIDGVVLSVYMHTHFAFRALRKLARAVASFEKGEAQLP